MGYSSISCLPCTKDGETLPEFLENKVFHDAQGSKIDPNPKGVEGFNAFLERYVLCLGVERQAVNCLKR